MKYTNRHGAIWSQVDRIQCAPDRTTIYNRDREKAISLDRTDRDLKNAFRL